MITLLAQTGTIFFRFFQIAKNDWEFIFLLMKDQHFQQILFILVSLRLILLINFQLLFYNLLNLIYIFLIHIPPYHSILEIYNHQYFQFNFIGTILKLSSFIYDYNDFLHYHLSVHFILQISSLEFWINLTFLCLLNFYLNH